MRLYTSILSILATSLLAAACAAPPETTNDGEIGTSEAALSNNMVTYLYHDCTTFEDIGYRIHGCNIPGWSTSGSLSQCFEVESEQCETAANQTVQFCEYGFCEVFYDPFGSIPTFEEWASSN